MKTKLLFLSLLVLSILGSCNIYNPAEPVPAYIHVDNIKVKGADTTATGQGTNSSKISDAWIYIDDQLIGCFEMPCTVPVISEGNHALRIRTGIKINGIAATRAPYPFYTDYQQSVSLQPGTTINITNATVTYLSFMTSTSHFPMIEDFENLGIKIIANAHTSEVPLALFDSPSSNVFEGNHSAGGVLHSNNTIFECKTIDSFLLNKNSLPVFLEFNYKCNQSFMVYLKGYPNYNTAEALSFNPSETWKKAYLFLTPAIAQLYAQSSATRFFINFQIKNNSGFDSVGLALDNIKIVQ